MDSVVEWEKMDEDVNIVAIHRNKHGEAECVKAKTVELQKLIDYNTYLQVEDLGRILYLPLGFCGIKVMMFVPVWLFEDLRNWKKYLRIHLPLLRVHFG